MKPFSQYLLMGMVLLLVALGAALTAMRFAIHGREVEVPRLIGMGLPEAQRAASNDGLSVEIEDHFYSSEIPEGRIVSQLPQPGTRVRRGWRVRAAQCLGPQGSTVPSVVGQSTRVAEIMIRRSGLDLGETAVARIPDVPADVVVAQSPPPNAVNLATPKVSLLLPANPEQKSYVMPYLLGRRFGEVADEIQQAGLKIGKAVDLSAPSMPVPQASVPALTGVPSTGPGATPGTNPAVNGAGTPAPAVDAGAAPPAPAAVVPPDATTAPLPVNPLAIVVRQTPAMGQRVTSSTSIYLDVSSQFQSQSEFPSTNVTKPEAPKPEAPK